MPISDLLASISGDRPQSSVSPGSQAVVAPLKRKAPEELREGQAKIKRTESAVKGSSRQQNSVKVTSQRTDNRRDIPAVSVPSSKPSPAKRPVETRPSIGAAKSNRPVSSRPPASRPVAAAADGGSEPKKRSFAEIMARAKAAQAAMPTLGRIQHKTLEKGLTKKEREELRAEEARNLKKKNRKAATQGPDRSASRQQNGTLAKSGVKSANGKVKAPVIEEEKKVKKAALATTGYTGTARPRPGASTSKPNRDTDESDNRSRSKPLYGGPLSSSRRRYDEDEDEMDDFIDYDDEEEPGYGNGGGGRRGYESMEDDESDMEAGMSEIDQEETRASYYARREDQEQEALEKRLKREKEERKRKLMESTRRGH